LSSATMNSAIDVITNVQVAVERERDIWCDSLLLIGH
jgi:hypothetical protein